MAFPGAISKPDCVGILGADIRQPSPLSSPQVQLLRMTEPMKNQFDVRDFPNTVARLRHWKPDDAAIELTINRIKLRVGAVAGVMAISVLVGATFSKRQVPEVSLKLTTPTDGMQSFEAV